MVEKTINPIVQQKLEQKNNDVVREIISNLDEISLNELFEGYDQDIDKLFEDIRSELAKCLDSYSDNLIDMKLFSQISHLGETIDEVLSIEYFNYFIDSRLPEYTMNWHHIEWGQLTQIYRLLCIIAARDHSKSYTFAFAYPLWRLFRYRKRERNGGVPRWDLRWKEGLLITNESSLARKHMRKIREEIEHNDRLLKLRPDSLHSDWGNDFIECGNGAQLSYKTAGSTMRGPHPSWIVVDDFLDKSVLYSLEQRNKFTEIFRSEIMNMLPRHGQLVNIGTPFHEEDLFGQLKKDKQFKVFEYPGVFPNGNLLDDIHHSIEEIFGKRDSQGSLIFSREILAKPVTDASSILPYHIISECFTDRFTIIENRHSCPIDFVRIVMGVDLARSGNVGADYTVFTTLGIDDKNRYWILNIVRIKGKPLYEQISILKSIYRNFRHDTIVVENNQMQQFFVDEGLRQSLPITPHTTGVNKYDLNKGFPSLVIVFEQGRILIPRGNQKSIDITDMLATELASMTWTEKGKIEGSGAHDDMSMSLLMAVIGARQGTGIDFAMA